MADLHFMQSRACLVNLVASKQASNSFYQPTVLINRGHTASAIVQTLNVEVTKASRRLKMGKLQDATAYPQNC